MYIKNLLISFFRTNRLYIFLVILLLVFNYLIDSAWLTNSPGVIFEAGPTVEWRDDFPSEEALRALILEGNVYALGLVAVTFLMLLGLVVGIAIDAVYLFYKAKGKDIIPRISPSREKAWNLADVFRAIILYFSFLALVRLFFVSGSFACLLQRITGSQKLVMIIDSFENMALGFSISYAVIIMVLAYFITIKYRQPFFSALGIKTRAILKAVLLGLASYISYLPLLFLALLISMGISEFFKMAPEENPLLNVFSIEGRPWLLFYFVLCVCIIGPIIEELFFRGFLYPALRKKTGVLLSVLLSSVFFSLLHMTFIGFLPIFFLGILLAYIYERSGNIIASIAIHIIHNSSITLFLFIIKGLGQ
jgi:membrane protease YdiL (CAAX protease family)